jgi:hypothetical protein
LVCAEKGNRAQKRSNTQEVTGSPSWQSFQFGTLALRAENQGHQFHTGGFLAYCPSSPFKFKNIVSFYQTYSGGALLAFEGWLAVAANEDLTPLHQRRWSLLP